MASVSTLSALERCLCQRFNEYESVGDTRTGFAYGAIIEDDDDTEQKSAVMTRRYEMNDTDDETEEVNRWTNLADDKYQILKRSNVLFHISQ